LRGAIDVRTWSVPAVRGPERSGFSTARCVDSGDGGVASAADRRSLTDERVFGVIISITTKAAMRVEPCR
jgi:hypothetical protein